MRLSLALAVLPALVSTVAAHGSLTIPQVRNSVDRHAPEWLGVRLSLSFFYIQS